jgi:cyclopropane-fatty-acyl-phospholipid synthase
MRLSHPHAVPAVSSPPSESRASRAVDRWAVGRIQHAVASAPLRFVLWDGFAVGPPAGPVLGTIVIKTRAALYRWLFDPELYFGEEYMVGNVEVRGDLVAVLEHVYRALPEPAPRDPLWRRIRSNGFRAARHNVHHHYDLGNDFYELWLDRQLLYTCAYFPDAACTLEEAQAAKMDLVCRKLRLQPGERVVEAGCGWGALALHMARHYGVQVRAFNISHEQILYARARAEAEGLSDQVVFVEDDYRTIAEPCDVFVSVGMLEHVGLAHYPALADVIHRVLKPDGRGLLHFIGRNRPAPLNRWIRKRIFPGGYPPTLAEVCERVLQPASLSVLDVENLRLHYARTLAHWLRRFEDAEERVTTMFDERFVRAWRLYLAGSQAAFTTGYMQLFQVLFARGATNEIPWTRRDIDPSISYLRTRRDGSVPLLPPDRPGR